MTVFPELRQGNNPVAHICTHSLTPRKLKRIRYAHTLGTHTCAPLGTHTHQHCSCSCKLGYPHMCGCVHLCVRVHMHSCMFWNVTAKACAKYEHRSHKMLKHITTCTAAVCSLPPQLTFHPNSPQDCCLCPFLSPLFSLLLGRLLFCCFLKCFKLDYLLVSASQQQTTNSNNMVMQGLDELVVLIQRLVPSCGRRPFPYSNVTAITSNDDDR